MRTWETRLPADAAAAAAARRFVLGTGAVPREHIDDVVLLVSELVTNAVKHTDSRTVGLRLIRSAAKLRVGVEDEGPGFENSTGASQQPGSGMGLRLVRKLADSRGISTDGRTRVWFELDC